MKYLTVPLKHTSDRFPLRLFIVPQWKRYTQKIKNTERENTEGLVFLMSYTNIYLRLFLSLEYGTMWPNIRKILYKYQIERTEKSNGQVYQTSTTSTCKKTIEWSPHKKSFSYACSKAHDIVENWSKPIKICCQSSPIRYCLFWVQACTVLFFLERHLTSKD